MVIFYIHVLSYIPFIIFILFYLFFNFTSCPSLFVQAVQAAHVAEEWVDHAHSKLKDEEACCIAALKAKVVSEKKTKESLLKLAEAERDRKNDEAALARVEKQAEDQRLHLKKAEE